MHVRLVANKSEQSLSSFLNENVIESIHCLCCYSPWCNDKSLHPSQLAGCSLVADTSSCSDPRISLCWLWKQMLCIWRGETLLFLQLKAEGLVHLKLCGLTENQGDLRHDLVVFPNPSMKKKGIWSNLFNI